MQSEIAFLERGLAAAVGLGGRAGASLLLSRLKACYCAPMHIGLFEPLGNPFGTPECIHALGTAADERGFDYRRPRRGEPHRLCRQRLPLLQVRHQRRKELPPQRPVDDGRRRRRDNRRPAGKK